MKIRLLSIFIVVSILFGMTGTVLAQEYGEGTEESPILITTQEELLLISDFPDCYFELGNDIVLTGSWTPLCTYTEDFTGVLDGKGYTISNLYMSNKRNMGLFDTNAGTIKNLNVQTSTNGLSYSGGDDVYIGIIAIYNNGAIKNCKVDGNVNYKYTSTSTGNSKIGGIAGFNTGIIEKCVSNIKIPTERASDSYIGGVAGYSYGENAVISNCCVKGNIVVSNSGGVMGGVAGKSSATIENSYFIGTLKGFEVGGICGNGDSATISNCYAVANSTAYSTGYEKGIVWYNSSKPTVTNSFYDQTVSGATDTGYGTPKSTLAMKMKRTYTNAGWDFDSIWGISSNMNGGYPYLLFEAEYIEEGIAFDAETQKATVSVTEDGEYAVIFADYENGSFVEAKMETVDMEVGSAEVSSPLTLSTEDRIFLWKNDAALAPLCEAEIVK